MESRKGKLCLATPLTMALVGWGMPCGHAAGQAGDVPGNAASPAEASSIPTASVPHDPCDWIPVSEVEAAIGKLAAVPERADGCRYTMVLPEAVSTARRETISREEQLVAQLEAQFPDWEPPEYRGPMAGYERDPQTYAVTLTVDVSGDMAGEMGTAAADRVLESWMPSPQAGVAEPAVPAGWDAWLPEPYGFVARVGHLRIGVSGHAPDVPLELAEALAARVRDLIPDLPFEAGNPYPMAESEEKHPCSLLIRDEAEAVLGPLVVAPYRSSPDEPPLAQDDGRACAYFTAGHHVFVLSPGWTGGRKSFELDAGLGKLVGLALPRENVILKGPWDAARIGVEGELLFLKGDRLLAVHYLTSSTDRGGAVRLAAKAIERMQAGEP